MAIQWYAGVALEVRRAIFILAKSCQVNGWMDCHIATQLGLKDREHETGRCIESSICITNNYSMTGQAMFLKDFWKWKTNLGPNMFQGKTTGPPPKFASNQIGMPSWCETSFALVKVQKGNGHKSTAGTVQHQQSSIWIHLNPFDTCFKANRPRESSGDIAV